MHTDLPNAASGAESKLQRALLSFENAAGQFHNRICGTKKACDEVAEKKADFTRELSRLKDELQVRHRVDSTHFNLCVCKDAEIAQERASEKEDFEQAEALNTTIAAAKHKIAINQTATKQLSSDANHLAAVKHYSPSQKARVLTQHIAGKSFAV